MEDEERSDGRFRKGQSGNPLGRPRKLPGRHRLPMVNRMAAFEVAETPITITNRNGERETTTVYRGVLMAVAQKALAGHAPSQKLLLQHVDSAAGVYGDTHALVQFQFREMARLEALVDAYEKKAEKQKTGVLVVSQEEWDRRMAEKNRLWEERKVRNFT